MNIIHINNTEEKEIIKQAVSSLKKGNLIIYPSETCYVLGADATNPKAVSKVIAYKGERRGKPLSVAVSGLKMAENYVNVNSTAENIFKNLLPGPVTVVCQGKHKVDPRVEAQIGTLGIRMPDHKLFLEISKKFGKPITATSANISGMKTPYSIEEIIKTLTNTKKKLLDLIINAGPLPHNPPSVVIDTTLDQPEITRQGKIDFSKLKAKSIITSKSKETIEFAKSLADKHARQLNRKCLIFALQGELGAGKTQYAKGVAKSLEIKNIINSPTFDLIREYPYQTKRVKGIFFHIDAWRIQSAGELDQLGFQQMLKPGNVILIEWIEKGKMVLEKTANLKHVKTIFVKISHIDKKKRRIEFTD